MIAHIDADAFFASVLIRKNPQWRGKPLLALGMGGTCVIAATYEAKIKGVKTGMRLRDALKFVPDALQIPADFHETAIASQEIGAVIAQACPIVERFSVDEWYLDLKSVTKGIPKALDIWAQTLQGKILTLTALSVSIGIAPTKILAKIAGEYHKPAGIMIIFPASSFQLPASSFQLPLKTFLCNRPAEAIPGIGKRRGIHTQANGWRTAWDFATADPERVKKLFGKSGRELQMELLGTVVSPITIEEKPPKSISRARSFLRTSDTNLLWAHVLRHLEYVVQKMRRHHLACRGMGLWIRHWDYSSASENRRLPEAMDTEDQLRPYVRDCFDHLLKKGALYSQTGMVLWDLRPGPGAQYSLFQETSESDRHQNIQCTLDTLHARFGRKSITRGAALPVSSQTTPELPYSIV